MPSRYFFVFNFVVWSKHRTQRFHNLSTIVKHPPGFSSSSSPWSPLCAFLSLSSGICACCCLFWPQCFCPFWRWVWKRGHFRSVGCSGSFWWRHRQNAYQGHLKAWGCNIILKKKTGNSQSRYPLKIQKSKVFSICEGTALWKFLSNLQHQKYSKDIHETQKPPF